MNSLVAIEDNGPCPEDHEILGFVERRLSPNAAKRIDAHVDTCGLCSALLADLAVMAGAEERTAPPRERSASIAGAVASDMGDFLPPSSHHGRYIIEALVGVGAMGAVYRAHDPVLDRHVAIKVLHDGCGPQGSQLTAEAQALAKLEHDNVVSVFDFGVHNGRSFLVAEFVAGQTLQAWLASDPPPERIVAVLVAAGRGLEAAHDAGIVHRDFKPSNVLIGADERVAVTDFGLAQTATTREGSGGSHVTGPARSTPDDGAPDDGAPDDGAPDDGAPDDGGPDDGAHSVRVAGLVGTPAYMAPEQATGAAATPRSDQFGFCVTACEALLGSRPDATPASLAQTSRALRAIVHRAGANALMRGMSEDPSARHVSMAVLLEALTRRRRPRLRGAVVFGALGASALLVVSQRSAAPAHTPCDLQSEHDPWGDDARNRLQAAFADSPESYAPAAWVAVQAGLDDHAQAWAAATTAICERVSRESIDAETARQARTCLRDNRRYTATLIDALGRADRTTLGNAARAVRAVPAPHGCVDDPRPDSSRNDDPELEAARMALHEGQVLDRLGDYASALVAVRRAESLAGPAADSHLRAQIAFGLGRLLARMETPAAGVTALERAHAIAVTSGHDDVAALAALALVRVHAHSAGHLQPARIWLGHARAAVVRDGHRRAEWLTAAALIHTGEGRPAVAAWHHLFAVGIAGLEQGFDAPIVAVALVNLAAEFSTMERYDAAMVLLKLALGRLESLLGAEHPRLAGVLVNLGLVLTSVGRYDDAAIQCQRGLDIRRQTHGADHLKTTFPLQCVAETELSRGRLQAADDALQHVADIEREHLDPNSVHHAMTLQLRLAVALWQGRTDDALAMARRSLALRHATLGPDNPVTAYASIRLGDALLQAGRVEEATTQIESGIEVLRRTVPADDEFMHEARISQGESWVGTARNADGLALLEAADNDLAARPAPVLDRARVAFALARALEFEGQDHARVAALLQRVEDALRDVPPNDLSRRIQAWATGRAPIVDPR